MNTQEINSIVNLRIAVYQEGCKAGLWPSLEENSALDYMKWLYPRTSGMAYYHLMSRIVEQHHNKEIPQDRYHLFKLPIQLEEEIDDYLKKVEDFYPIMDNEQTMEYISSLVTVVCDTSLSTVDIGKLADDLNHKVNVMAFHYYNVFTKNYPCFPYFS